MDVKVPDFSKETSVVFNYILSTIKDIELNNSLYKHEYWEKVGKANKKIIESSNIDITDLDNAFKILFSVFVCEKVINSYKFNTALMHFKKISDSEKTNLKRVKFAKNIETIGREYYKFRENNIVSAKYTNADVAMAESMFMCENVKNFKTARAYEKRFEKAVSESVSLTSTVAQKTKVSKEGEKSK